MIWQTCMHVHVAGSHKTPYGVQLHTCRPVQTLHCVRVSMQGRAHSVARMAAGLTPSRRNAARMPSYTAASLPQSACCSADTVTLARQLSLMSVTFGGGGGSEASSAVAVALMEATAPATWSSALHGLAWRIARCLHGPTCIRSILARVPPGCCKCFAQPVQSRHCYRSRCRTGVWPNTTRI